MTPAGLDRLKLDEGLNLVAYPDPRTGAAPWTIGYGCTGPGITKGTVWTQGQADATILARVQLLAQRLKGQLIFWPRLSPVQQDVLINIAYNIGVAGLLKWTITLAAAGRGDNAAVAEDIRTNKVWSSEVGDRATRCADAFETSSWEPVTH